MACAVHPPRAVREQFWLAAILFHMALGAVVVVLLSRRSRRLHAEGPTVRGLVADACRFAAASLVLAALGGLIMRPVSGFTILRLLAQALFGESIVWAVGLAVIHGRHGSRSLAGLTSSAAAIAVAVYWQAYHRE